jgi:hypothetical protein
MALTTNSLPDTLATGTCTARAMERRIDDLYPRNAMDSPVLLVPGTDLEYLAGPGDDGGENWTYMLCGTSN